MDATLKIIDHQAYLDYGGALYPVGAADYEPDERACTLTIFDVIKFIEHLDDCLYEALGKKDYRWVKYREDELEMKFEIRRMYEINKLDKMWETSDEKQVHKES
jgi:hypothetical protein